MTFLKSALRRSVFFAAASAALAGNAYAALTCHKIDAKGVGQDLGGGVTVAQINDGGLLQGTTQGSFLITGGAVPSLAIAGTVIFTTRQSTLTVAVTGTFNVATGVFVTTGPVAAATGKMAGATGTLTLEGIEDLTTGKFIETVSGTICVDLKP